MNRFAILYCLAFFHISYEPVQARTKFWRIKEMRINDKNLQVIKEEDMYLYKVSFELRGRHKFYELEVGNDSNTFSDPFPISASSTLVTKNEIIVRLESKTVTIILDGNAKTSTYALYLALFPFGDFFRWYRAAQILENGVPVVGVRNLKVKMIENSELLLAVLRDNDEPHFILPNTLLNWASKKDVEVEISAGLKFTQPRIQITIRFTDSILANGFYRYFNPENETKASFTESSNQRRRLN